MLINKTWIFIGQNANVMNEDQILFLALRRTTVVKIAMDQAAQTCALVLVQVKNFCIDTKYMTTCKVT